MKKRHETYPPPFPKGWMGPHSCFLCRPQALSGLISPGFLSLPKGEVQIPGLRSSSEAYRSCFYPFFMDLSFGAQEGGLPVFQQGIICTSMGAPYVHPHPLWYQNYLGWQRIIEVHLILKSKDKSN